MNKPYSSHKAIKKSFALKGLLLLFALALIFAAFMVRYAMSGSRDTANGIPNSDDAYSVAKEFIRPTIKSPDVNFPESDYQCAKKPDSVFIIKSYAESKGVSGAKNVTTFEITLRFFGGKVSSKDSWKVLNLNED
ncbi:MAG TPA: hypothetical protein VHC47_02730 [Mucilaginibacter sp.]|nr:hypothetical protein [Mucilaginibacter sp.]